MRNTKPNAAIDATIVQALFDQVRKGTERLTGSLSPEDSMLQSMEDASPPKWHLAHTTWFFEEFILKPRLPGYQTPDTRFALLFNSYYVQAGPRHARDKRGLISRPGLTDVMDYRHHVTDAIAELLALGRDDTTEIAQMVELGCHHEMQHQELLVTDLLNALSFNPLLPPYRAPGPLQATSEVVLTFDSHAGGLIKIGYKGAGFAYDCESPRHQTWLAPYAIANRPVSNRDWIAFVDDGGYDTPCGSTMVGPFVMPKDGTRHCIGGGRMMRGGPTRCAVRSRSTSMHPSCTSAIMRQRLLHAGQARVCRPNPNGKMLPRHRLPAISWMAASCAPCPAADSGAMSGSGRKVCSHPIPAFKRQTVPSGNTTVNS